MKRFAVLLFAVAVAAPAAQAPPSTHNPAPPASGAASAREQRREPPPLGPNGWRIDPSHSAANFAVKHMMVTTVRGQLGPISGSVDYDGKDVRSVKADVSIDVKGLSTRNERRDNHLRTDDFFNAESHPAITFKSRRVEPGPAGRFKLIGDLSIRGTTKEVVLDVEGPTPPMKDQRGVRVGATATTKINRLEYGLKWNNMIEAGPIVSDEVNITIDLELTRPAVPAVSSQ
jgi:polyisoprenoid-binding protein YceI